MAAFNKIEAFVEHLANKIIDLFGTDDTFKVMLTNAAPTAATDAVKADLTEITAENGYTAGGADTANNGTRSGGTVTVVGTKVVWTASGGTIGPFRYVVLYDDTPTSPVDPLVGWWDYGSALTLQDGETFSVKFNGSETTGDMLTLA